jgi:hypothetical protein
MDQHTSYKTCIDVAYLHPGQQKKIECYQDDASDPEAG